jgi:hypothetical protein
VKLLNFNTQVSRQWRKNINVSTSSCHLERFSLFALLVHVNQLTWLYTERWAVNSLAIHQDVAVYYKLTRLSDGAGKASTQNNSV